MQLCNYALEKLPFSDTKNSKSVSSLIDSQWAALSAYQRQFIANNSDAIIWKTKNFFSVFFFAFLKSILNFKHFSKKDDPCRSCISRNDASDKYG